MVVHRQADLGVLQVTAVIEASEIESLIVLGQGGIKVCMVSINMFVPLEGEPSGGE